MPSYFPNKATVKLNNYFTVTADMTSVTWNTVAAHEIATITGAVHMIIIPQITGSLTSGASLATLVLGDETVTNSLIPITTAANLALGEWWVDADTTRTVISRTLLNAVDFTIGNGKDVGYTVATEAFTGGSILFHCYWEPMDSTGAVVAGAGGIL